MIHQDLLPTEAALRRIHETALRTLSEVGIRLDHEEMRERLSGRGCRVKGSRLLIPPEVVAETLAQVPSEFTLYGRSVDQPVTVGLTQTLCTNTGIFANLYDFESGELRRSTVDDVRMTTRLLDAMDHVHLVYVSLVDATEMASHMVTLTDFAEVLANTTKPLVGPGVANRAEAEAVVAMARAVRGDAEKLQQFPLCVPFVCSVSPLYFPEAIVDAVVAIAEAGMPFDALSNPVMGLTAPYTLAGTVALGHAEVLALAVMAETVTPGLPILSQNTPSIADMRTLASTTGGPETGMIRQTAVALSQMVGIPGSAHGHTSAARLDLQAADEKTWNTLLIASASPAILGGLGALANVTATAYETILLDDERYGAFLRILAGMDTSEEALAFEVLSTLGKGADVLTHPHTLARLRSGEIWRPKLALRQGLLGGTAPAEGMAERARAATRELMETYTVPPLPEEVAREIGLVLSAYDWAHKG